MYINNTIVSKFKSILLYLAVTCSILVLSSVVSLADASTVLSVDNVSGNKGTSVDVKVNITANSAMAGGSFNLEYDPAKVAPSSFVVGSIISGTLNNVNMAYSSNAIRVNWAGTNPINSAGAVVTIKFNILTTAATGVSNLTLRNPKLIDKDTNDITFTTALGSITITSPNTSTVLSVDNVSGNKGTSVDVKVNITANSAMAGGSFNLEYDPAKIAPTSYVVGSIISGTLNNVNMTFASNLVRVNWAGTNPINSAGAVVTIKFNILSTAASGATSLTLKNSKLIDKDTNDISFNTTNGSINITSDQDTTPPTFVSSDPANNATNIALSKVVTCVFSENIKAGDAYSSIVLKDNSGTIVTTTKAINGNSLTVTPSANLSEGIKYTLTIPQNAVKDITGNSLAAATTVAFTTAVSSNNALKVTIGSKNGYVGKLVTIPIDFKNIPAAGVGNCDFVVQYNLDKFEVVSVTAGDIIHDVAKDFSSDSTTNPGLISILYNDDSVGDYPIRNEGIFASIQFKVKDGTALGDYNIVEKSMGGFADSTLKEIPVVFFNGKITVCNSIMYGDLDGNSLVNSTDYAYLKKYFLGKITTFPAENGLIAADVDGNNVINSTDYAYIKKYLLGKITKFPAEN